jgi:hypothetical protein
MENNDRAYAHYKRAKMYTKYGDVKKASAHMGRAMHYYRRGGSTRFGNDWELDPDGAWTLTFVSSKERNEDSLVFTFVRRKEQKTMMVRGLADKYTGNKLQYIIRSPIGRVYSPKDAKAYLPSFLEAILANTEKAWNWIDEFQRTYSNVKYSKSSVVSKLLEWKMHKHEGADYEILD